MQQHWANALRLCVGCAAREQLSGAHELAADRSLDPDRPKSRQKHGVHHDCRRERDHTSPSLTHKHPEMDVSASVRLRAVQSALDGGVVPAHAARHGDGSAVGSSSLPGRTPLDVRLGKSDPNLIQQLIPA